MPRCVRARSKPAIWSAWRQSAVGSPGAPPLSGGSGFLNGGGLAGFLYGFFRGFLATLPSNVFGRFFCGGFLGGGLADALRAAFLEDGQDAGAQGLLNFLRRAPGVHDLEAELLGHLVKLLDDHALVFLETVVEVRPQPHVHAGFPVGHALGFDDPERQRVHVNPEITDEIWHDRETEDVADPLAVPPPDDVAGGGGIEVTGGQGDEGPAEGPGDVG